eukprot:1137065-Pelagomonas_calceolata.AAC.3
MEQSDLVRYSKEDAARNHKEPAARSRGANKVLSMLLGMMKYTIGPTHIQDQKEASSSISCAQGSTTMRSELNDVMRKRTTVTKMAN